MNKLIILIISTLFLSSCDNLTQEVDPSRLPEGTSKVVIHGYLSPQDEVIRIKIGYSVPIVGNKVYYNNQGTQPNTTDLGFKVQISDGTNSILLPYVSAALSWLQLSSEANHEIPTSQFKILAGKTYFLTVTDKNGMVYESSCTIPQAVNIGLVLKDSVVNKGNDTNPFSYIFRLKWQDPTGIKNYYALGGESLIHYKIEKSENVAAFEYDSRMKINFNASRGGNSSFYNDNNMDGSTFDILSKATELTDILFNTNVKWRITERRITIALISCDKNYYDFHQAINNFDGDNPFAEPTLVPSNIKGGLGCFAGFNKTVYVGK